MTSFGDINHPNDARYQTMNLLLLFVIYSTTTSTLKAIAFQQLLKSPECRKLMTTSKFQQYMTLFLQNLDKETIPVIMWAARNCKSFLHQKSLHDLIERLNERPTNQLIK